jgi:hypothetical protein
LSSSPPSSSSINPCSTPAVAFNDISINSGLAAGEFWPVLQINSKPLVVTTQALYSFPAFTVTFGNVATYSIIPALAAGFVVEGDKVVRLEDEASNASVSRNLTFDASPSFTVPPHHLLIYLLQILLRWLWKCPLLFLSVLALCVIVTTETNADVKINAKSSVDAA